MFPKCVAEGIGYRTGSDDPIPVVHLLDYVGLILIFLLTSLVGQTVTRPLGLKLHPVLMQVAQTQEIVA